MAAVTSIMRAQQIVLARVDAVLKPLDLTFARYEALVLLSFSRTGALPLGKMGDRLMLHPTSVTNIIDRLEDQGLVRRVSHPTDRRTTLAEITDEGRKVVEAATEATSSIALGMGQPLGPRARPHHQVASSSPDRRRGLPRVNQRLSVFSTPFADFADHRLYRRISLTPTGVHFYTGGA